MNASQVPSMDLPYDLSILQELIGTPDDIGAVLRGQLIVERCLIHKCGQFFPTVEQVFGDRLDARICLNLLQLVGAPTDLISPCRRINKLRNDFAHGKLNALNMQHINEIISLLPVAAKTMINDGKVASYDESGKEITPQLAALPRIKFSLIIAVVQMGILTSHGHYNVSFGFNFNNINSVWQQALP